MNRAALNPVEAAENKAAKSIDLQADRFNLLRQQIPHLRWHTNLSTLLTTSNYSTQLNTLTDKDPRAEEKEGTTLILSNYIFLADLYTVKTRTWSPVQSVLIIRPSS